MTIKKLDNDYGIKLFYRNSKDLKGDIVILDSQKRVLKRVDNETIVNDLKEVKDTEEILNLLDIGIFYEASGMIELYDLLYEDDSEKSEIKDEDKIRILKESDYFNQVNDKYFIGS